mmetsp:Transcript_11491/g.29352  ORF Transcript_11491/g.29352 Transcript_11491/m.29352 type:complete len:201 (-) Transcript_11491:489-1091(-)
MPWLCPALDRGCGGGCALLTARRRARQHHCRAVGVPARRLLHRAVCDVAGGPSREGVLSNRRQNLRCYSSVTMAAATNQALELGLWPTLSPTELSRCLHQTVVLLDCTPSDAVDIARRCPDILIISPAETARRIVTLKSLLPRANLPELLKLRPSLLLLRDMEAKIGHAIKQMHALMPGTDVEAKLHLMGTQYWTFVELL